MHKIVPTYRRIADADLPRVRDLETGESRPPTVDELLSMGIVHVNEDLYSCAEQYLSPDDVIVDIGGKLERVWHHESEPVPADPLTAPHTPEDAAARRGGQVLGAGDVRERHRQLPASVRGKILRAHVIRGTDDVNALETVEANLLEQQAAIEAAVGDVLVPDAEPRPLVDFGKPDVVLEEARRLVAIPDNGIERVTVTMVDVAADADVVEADNLIPHAWAGERVPR